MVGYEMHLFFVKKNLFTVDEIPYFIVKIDKFYLY